jgi:hypothetical protein
MERQCIYCLTRDGDFDSEEYVIPESLAGDELVLRDSVCRRCNNDLARLDEALVSFEPVAFLRTIFGPLTKAGEFPRARFRDVDIEKVAPRAFVRGEGVMRNYLHVRTNNVPGPSISTTWIPAESGTIVLHRPLRSGLRLQPGSRPRLGCHPRHPESRSRSSGSAEPGKSRRRDRVPPVGRVDSGVGVLSSAQRQG